MVTEERRKSLHLSRHRIPFTGSLSLRVDSVSVWGTYFQPGEHPLVFASSKFCVVVVVLFFFFKLGKSSFPSFLTDSFADYRILGGEEFFPLERSEYVTRGTSLPRSHCQSLVSDTFFPCYF